MTDRTDGKKIAKVASAKKPLTRRRFIETAGGTVAAAAVASVLPIAKPAIAATRTIKIGYVSPQTGPLAAFAEADNFVIAGIREALKGGIKRGRTSHPVEIIVKDSKSSPNRAAEVAANLISRDKIDLMLVASTPETVNPVADRCELDEVPCVSTLAPWQPYFFGRGGNPAKGFKWTYHYLWGLEDVIAVFTNLWDELPTNKIVGGLFPNDGDGNAWGDKKRGFPPVLAKKGYKLIDPGRYQNLTDDFSAQISAFKSGGVEIVTGVVLPPDFTTFWVQAKQQGFRPKAASIGKALLFPAAVEALGDGAHNLSSEIWWSPSHPFASSLTGQSAAKLANAYVAASGKQWTQPIGFVHSLFEMANDIFKRTADVGDSKAVLEAITKTHLDTIVGKLSWQFKDARNPVKNVCRTRLVSGQWRRAKSGRFKYELVITNNKTAPEIPTGGQTEVIA